MDSEFTRVRGAWNAKSNMEKLKEVETRITGAVQDLTFCKVTQGIVNQVSRTPAKAMLPQSLSGMQGVGWRPRSVAVALVGEMCKCFRKGPTPLLEPIENPTLCLSQRHT